MSQHISLPSGLATITGLVLVSSVIASTVTAQTSLTWVKDINTTPITLISSSLPSPSRSVVNQNSQQWVRMGRYFYFQARNGNSGAELFRSDGTTATLVKDIYPGSASSSPSYFTLVGNRIYFRAKTNATGQELWVTDGTATGTRLVKDIRTGRPSSYVANLARVGRKVVFSANDGTRGYEIWVSDGTAAGTRLLKDIHAGASSSAPVYLTSNLVGSMVFFQANEAKNGRELWVTDGTAAGTRLVQNIHPGFTGSGPRSFLRLGSKRVVFTADDGTSGHELWISDGTLAGTSLVKDVYPGNQAGANTYSGVSLGNKVLFLGTTTAAGSEAWITDGTTAGTMMLKNIAAGSSSSFMYFSDVDGGKAYWGCRNSSLKYEIWVTDGTTAGTRLFSGPSMSRSKPFNIAVTGGKVFFCGYDVTARTGYELCMTDGTTTATVKDIRTGIPHGLSTYANYISKIGPGIVALAADNGTGPELWVSKGTATTTTMIDINKPIGPPPTADDNVRNITALFGKVIFSATDGANSTKGQRGQELWISDGTGTNTRLLKDVNQTTGSYPNSLCRLGNDVYFNADGGAGGRGLWRTNGTLAGTNLFKATTSGPTMGNPIGMTRVGDKIYFTANTKDIGYELWVTDGTPSGTVLVKDIASGWSSSFPARFARLGMTNKALFTAFTSALGFELWITDGTAAGTKLVKDINAASKRSSNPEYLTSYKGKVYFQAYTPTSGFELWASDGTLAGTRIVKEGGPGASSGYAGFITVQNGKLYYRGFTLAAGYEMHSSDGTAANTGLYWDYTARLSTDPRYITAVGSRRLFFRGDIGGYGDFEPHFFDVTNKTSMIWNANGSGSSFPSNLGLGQIRFAVDNAGVYASARRSKVYDFQLLRISNGATAQPIGRVQDSSSLTATDPRIGQIMTISGRTRVTNPLNVIALGLPLSMPSALGPLVPNSYAYFNLTNYYYVAGSFAGATYNTPFSVPNDIGIVGRSAVMQCFALDVVAFPAKVEVTNGVHISFGR